jgi:hypothetical protein
MSLQLNLKCITVNNNPTPNESKKSIEQDMKNRIHSYMKGLNTRIQQQIQAVK